MSILDDINKIISKHYFNNDAVENVSSKYEIKDCSKGCDNNVFAITFKHDSSRIIIRKPKSIDCDTPAMHTPLMQSIVMKLYASVGVSVPSLIFLDENDEYSIETYMPENDLGEIYIKPTDMNDVDKQNIFTHIGRELGKMHSIKTCGYGDIKYYSKSSNDGDTPQLEGNLTEWIQFFNQDVPDQIESCLKNDYYLLNILQHYASVDQVVNDLHSLFNQAKQYLLSFNQPCLVHADVCSNNIRVSKESISDGTVTSLKYIGLIDFADGKSGDGLYDIGRILHHVYGDWSFIECIEQGYFQGDNSGKFSIDQQRIIVFYALSFCIWLLDISENNQEIIKYNTILNNLLKLYRKMK
ncbi:hypothetical protein CYY_001152 [Polysphondylium violaceum]|uniref:Aminoglycoside phosphotransferase domain-containing protein n=1 Tax=Polysphondylium violaceum TaxID=133409 RepID=A0A8J4VAV0_9MYCE|nr:hypothetical protein CYY_001152 [Polysphondylium violaceum]